MTIPNSLANDTTPDADEVMANFGWAGPMFHPVYYPVITAIAIVAHSAAIWSAINTTNTVRSIDSGLTWVAASADTTDMTGPTAVCEANKAYAISCSNASAGISFTTDSGDNWIAATTDPLNITNVLCIANPTTTSAVVGCDYGTAGSGVFLSTDNGVTWVESTTKIVADVEGIAMVSATHGLCIDSANNIYYTTNGGVDWTDSTENQAIVAKNGQLFITDNTAGIISFVVYDGVGITYGKIDSTGGAGDVSPVGVASLDGADTADVQVTNFVQATNGNTYVVAAMANAVDMGGQLWKTMDNGATWNVSSIPSYMSTFTGTNNTLVEAGDNQLLLIGQNGKMIIKLDVVNDPTS